MANAPQQWQPTKETAWRFAGISVLHGGPEAGSIAEHSHAEAEVSVHFRSSGAGRRVVPEHVHLYATKQPHCGGWKIGHEVVVFLLSPDLLAEAADELSCCGQFAIVPFRHRRERIFESVGRIVLDEFRGPDRLHAFHVQSIGNVLAGHIARNYGRRHPRVVTGKALNDTELRTVRRFIEERLENGFSVAEIALEVGLRPQEFAQRLYLAVGLSPWQFVERQRFSMAKWLLRNRRASLADIACRLGFVDQSHFTNAFRRISGVTPSVFRRES